MVGTSAAATVAGILTLAKSNQTLVMAGETLAKSNETLVASRLAAESLLAVARRDAEVLLELARLRAAERLKSEAASERPIRENTAALGENTESVRANTRAAEASGPR